MHMKQSKKRKTLREADWKNLIDEWLKSGKKISDFCQEKKIAKSGFYMQRNRFYPDLAKKQLDPKQQSTLFIPVPLERNVTGDIGGGLTLIYPNGCQLRIAGHLDISAIKILNNLMGIEPC